MRREALTFLMCPDCDGELSLEGSVAPEADGHILSGKLNCQGCASNFTIRNGVPVLLPAKMASVKLETKMRSETTTRGAASCAG